MADGFPRKFCLAAMAGVTAREFEKREDAFQQLVGDGLLAMSGHSAKSYPTKGEDGSIDSYLEAGAPLIAPFDGLPLPAVIECKDHDDSLPRVGENILGGWDKVRAKLATQAKEGWPDLFKPWREAKSYVYVVSAVIPTQDVRDALERRIQGFFASLPVEQRPPVERIILMDWNDARRWLDCFPDVRDSWLGTGDPSILSLDQYRAGLSGFRRFLGDESLPFRAPAADSIHHPHILFSRLIDSQAAQGILLVGAGGVGKTRTSYEVALLAEKQGWRVLYVLPTDPPVTIEQLSASVLSQRSCETLVIFEYLDQMPHLDVGALRRSLIPQAREAGIHLACLANSRPGFIWKPHAERDALFTRVELSLSSYEAQALSEWAVKRTAPKACGVLSDEEVFRICGRRPIIALLVAQQLERLAIAGTLDAKTVQPIREDDLLGPWLRRRLAEDELTTPTPQSFWETAQPEPRVVAAAAVLTCAPDDLNGLHAASASALAALGSKFDSQKIMEGLLELGWLERDGPWLVAVHDVVADEVAEQTIFMHSAVRGQEFDAMVSVGETRTRSFGRIAKALSRVHGATSDGRKGALNKASEDWLNRHADEIGLMIASEAPTHGSYALGAVFGGSLFEHVAIHQWSAIVAPWLAKYDTDFEARHLFYRGLRAVSGDSSVDLKRAAIAWLSRWRLEYAASFVLAPLLHVRDLLHEETGKLNSWSVDWLASYGNALEAQFVLGPLLSRKDVKEPEAGEAVAHALAWLGDESHAKSAEARFVLEPLLSRKDVKEPEAGEAVAHALAWLGDESQAKSAEAQFVLGPLLSRKDVKEPEAGQAIAHALAWLGDESHAKSAEAQFVLGPLLSRKDVKEPEAGKAIEHALAWLGDESHAKSAEAGFVLGPLLSRKDVKEPEAGKAIAHALAWLGNESHAKSAEAQFVLGPLLSRKDVKEPEAGKAIAHALAWLGDESHAKSAEAQFVLGPQLSRKDVKEQEAGQAVAHALAWLGDESHAKSAEARFVLEPLLSRKDVKEPEAGEAVAHALAWLGDESQAKLAEAGFVLGPLLSRKDVKEPEAGQAIAHALAWLGDESHAKSAEAGFVLGPLLSRKDVKEPEAGQAIAHALAWLGDESHAKSAEAGFVLGPLLSRKDVKEPEAGKAVAHALAWLGAESHAKSAEARFVLEPLLSRKDVKEPEAGKAIAHALAWLNRFGTTVEASFVLAPCLYAESRHPEFRDSTIQWCEKHADKFQASFVLTTWLKKCGDSRRVSEFVARWLHARTANENTSFLLFAWMRAGGDRGVIAPYVRQFINTWRDGRVVAALEWEWNKGGVK